MNQYVHLVDERSIEVIRMGIGSGDDAPSIVTAFDLTTADVTTFSDMTDAIDQVVLRYDNDLIKDALGCGYKVIVMIDTTEVYPLMKLLIELKVDIIDPPVQQLISTELTSIIVAETLNRILNKPPTQDY